ncbi:MAG: cyclic nucleotide-binding domain-containing protein [Desulfobacterales bacterium]|nr:cyclic nucleotide-binding domain-containing protein [Desulfobacterales bacterium]
MLIDTQALETLNLFKGFEPDEIEQIASLMHHKRTMEGEVLTRRGDCAETFYILISGYYIIYFEEGESVVLHKKGEIIGWSTAATLFNYLGTTVALTDGEVLSMPGEDFLDLIRNNSMLGDKIMKKINKIVAERMNLIKKTRNN